MLVMFYCNLLTGPPMTVFCLFLFWYLCRPFSTYLYLLYTVRQPLPALWTRTLEPFCALCTLHPAPALCILHPAPFRHGSSWTI